VIVANGIGQGVLITVLIVLAIVALILWIVRR
jgi:hypothetical protein